MDIRIAINLVETALRESRSAPLFHATHLPYALRILANDCLGLPSNDTVSFSRSYDKAFSISASGSDHDADVVVFVLDQDRLSRRFRMEPFHDVNWQDSGPYASDSDMTDEEEEILYGMVKPLETYLVSINVDVDEVNRLLVSPKLDYRLRSLFSSEDDARNALSNLLRHPKINKFSTRIQQSKRKKSPLVTPGSVVYANSGWYYIERVDGKEVHIRSAKPSFLGGGWTNSWPVRLQDFVPIAPPHFAGPPPAKPTP